MIDPVLETVRAWADESATFALATVVGVRGSTYRGLAARQLLSEVGTSVGTVSGGCLDADLQEVAVRVMKQGEAERVEFDLTADDEAVWGWGVGCNGATDLLVEPATTAVALAELVATPPPGPFCIVHPLHRPDERSVVTPGEGAHDPVVVAARSAIEDGRHARRTIGGHEYLFEVVGMSRRLVVFGAGHDASPMVSLAASLGFRTVVVDARRQFLTVERFPQAQELIHAEPSDLARVARPDHATAVVLMSHNYVRDLEALRSLVGTDVAYVGALGPGERLERLLADLAASGTALQPGDMSKLHGPAGLDLGAEGPVEIAWSVLSEVLAVLRGRSGTPLRRVKGPEPLRG